MTHMTHETYATRQEMAHGHAGAHPDRNKMSAVNASSRRPGKSVK